MTKKFAVIGHPVNHSLSPAIHYAFAKQLGFDIEYQKIDPGLHGFKSALLAFRKEGGSGASVTLPFKQELSVLADRCTSIVTASGAANTLWWNDSNELYADNTDGLGLIWDLERLSLVLKGARVLLLGAGGAAAGILPSLLKEKPQKIYVANRTIERAHELVARQESIFFSCLKAVLFEENYSEPMDLVLHATSLGHQGRTPDLSETALGEKTVCYDLSYGDSAKPFLRWARERGVLYCAEGIGMLVAQAAEQFERWNGKRPNVLEALNEINLLLSSGMG